VPHAAREGDFAAAYGRLATVAEAVACHLGSWDEAEGCGVRPRQCDNAAWRAVLDRLTAQPRDAQLGELAELAGVQWVARAEARGAERGA
jgi:hypothetical protein